MRRAGRLLVGRSRRRRGTPTFRVAGLSRRHRRTLGAHWRRLAELEHASITAFEHLALQLRFVGAPEHLVVRCTTAAAQETDHAERCFDLASRYLGGEVRPGRVTMPPIGEPILAALAVESLRDGMLNESYAAWIAAQQLHSCTDGHVARALRVIAHDEAEHAELSAAIVEWCVRVGGPPVRAAVEAAADDLPRLAITRRKHDPTLAGHGMAIVDRNGDSCEQMRRDVRRWVASLISACGVREPVDAAVRRVRLDVG